MIGQKGIPARYGGVERHVEEIALRLAASGVEVSVYCRSYFTPERGPYRGVERIHVPSIATKHLDAGTHALCSTLHAMSHDADIVHYHGIGPSLFAPLARAAGKRVIMTYHAQDWRQVKWGVLARRFLLRGESNGVRASHRVITVSALLRDYVRSRYGVEAVRIPNGANLAGKLPPEGIRESFGLEKDGYVLSVGRMIEDRAFDELILAFRELDRPIRLVLVGDGSFDDSYVRRLRELADDRVLFTGSLCGRLLDELYSNARLYVNPSRLEGFPISVLEAMGFGTPVLVSDIPENLEAIGSAGFQFRAGDAGDLVRVLRALLDDRAGCEARGRLGRERVAGEFAWDGIARAVLEVYGEVIERPAGGPSALCP